tara:strand:+ start:543 stop:962 length:420 start_codon:yes stop_codon:yes gene_type:complete
MKKRNVFDELVQGFDDLQAEREGKITLKSTTFEPPQPIAISAGQITALRERLNYSQGVFAALLRTNVSTLRNWEQDRAKPNAQAALLLKLVESAPEDILGKLSALGEKKRRGPSRKTPVKRRARQGAPPKKAAKKRAVA